MIDEGVIVKINERLQDQTSRKIFANRLLYGITDDNQYLKEVVDQSRIYKLFYEMMEADKNGRIIYGIGDLGKSFVLQYGDRFDFKAILDSNHYDFNYCGIDVCYAEKYLAGYAEEKIYVCAWLSGKDIVSYLETKGIPAENIVDVSAKIRETWDEWQYFDLPQMQPEKDEVFIDGGCFDGGNAQRFIKWAGGDFKAIYSYEPDSGNYANCQKRLEEIAAGKYQLIDKGLWDTTTELHFAMDNDGGSAISENAESVVEVTSVDQSVSDEVTFIKFDIEGAEVKALEGARKQITENKPKLAICVYHKPEDIYSIPELILEMNPDYKFYIRHYSLNEWETVLYAL